MFKMCYSFSPSFKFVVPKTLMSSSDENCWCRLWADIRSWKKEHILLPRFRNDPTKSERSRLPDTHQSSQEQKNKTKRVRHVQFTGSKKLEIPQGAGCIKVQVADRPSWGRAVRKVSGIGTADFSCNKYKASRGVLWVYITNLVLDFGFPRSVLNTLLFRIAFLLHHLSAVKPDALLTPSMKW